MVVPENRTTFDLSLFVSVIDDDTLENEEWFVIVVIVGIPGSFTCFQTPCSEGIVATEIRINDNDRKYYYA